jgi:hypothetical protein
MMILKTATGKRKTLEWHVGEPLPIVDMRKVSITVDCDELDWLVAKMRETRNVQQKEVAAKG